MNGGQLGRICRAIEELAACSGSDDGAGAAAAADAGEGGTAGAAGGRDDPDISRLAAIWEMVADADPELAKRLPGYLSATE
ncbi:MAG TPA: hypothetical protein VMC83_07405 [Streptosporangiaceae bacterium]|nr:hypothetical protein [Streptosporangiaceae bacterium]